MSTGTILLPLLLCLPPPFIQGQSPSFCISSPSTFLGTWHIAYPFSLLETLLWKNSDSSNQQLKKFKEIQVLRQNKIKNLTPSPIPLFPSDTCNFSISCLSSQTSWKNSRYLLSSPSTESSPGGHYFHSHHSNQKGVQHSHHKVPFPKSNGFSFQSLPCFSAALEAFECSPCFKPFRFSLFWTCPWVR